MWLTFLTKTGKLDNLIKFVGDNGKLFYGVRESNIINQDHVLVKRRLHRFLKRLAKDDLTNNSLLRRAKLCDWQVEWNS